MNHNYCPRFRGNKPPVHGIQFAFEARPGEWLGRRQPFDYFPKVVLKMDGATEQKSTSSALSITNGTIMSKDGTREIKKRQRQWLSCQACHKMKVKCDRGQPCGRCARADRGDKCFYEVPKKKPKKTGRLANGVKVMNGSQPDPNIDPPEKFVKYRKGKVRHGGRTHWALIAHEFTEMKQFMHGEVEGGEALTQRLKGLKKFFPRKRLHNYPFTPSREPRYSTRDGIVATLPDRAHVKRLVDVYFDTFEKILSLFHEPTFKAVLETFYDHPDSVENGWIASLFLMLALSHHITTQSNMDAPYLSSAGQVEAYLESAQAALHLSPFMLKPTLDSLRALCIVAIGKSLEIVGYFIQPFGIFAYLFTDHSG